MCSILFLLRRRVCFGPSILQYLLPCTLVSFMQSLLFSQLCNSDRRTCENTTWKLIVGQENDEPGSTLDASMKARCGMDASERWITWTSINSFVKWECHMARNYWLKPMMRLTWHKKFTIWCKVLNLPWYGRHNIMVHGWRERACFMGWTSFFQRLDLFNFFMVKSSEGGGDRSLDTHLHNYHDLTCLNMFWL